MDGNQDYEVCMGEQSRHMSRIGELAREQGGVNKKLETTWRIEERRALINRLGEIDVELSELPCLVAQWGYEIACAHLPHLKTLAEEAQERIGIMQAEIEKRKLKSEYLLRRAELLEAGMGVSNEVSVSLDGIRSTGAREIAKDLDALDSEFFGLEARAQREAEAALEDARAQAKRYNADLDRLDEWEECAEAFALGEYQGAKRYLTQALRGLV